MITFVREITWLSAPSHGWGNGYVIIPKGHPAHGKHYDQIDVEVHGGLTFAEGADDIKNWPELQGLAKEYEDGWVVGFDTCHAYDDPISRTEAFVREETEKLKKQLEALS